MLDWLLSTLVSALSALLCRLPPTAAVWLGEQVGVLAMRLQPKRVQIGAANLRAAFDGRLSPRQIRGILRACFAQLGAGIMEMLRLPVMDRAYMDRYVAIEGRRHLDAARASGRPVMFLTGHYGNWELSSIAAALEGFPIVALARAQERFPRLYRLLVSFRESKGCTIVHKGGALRRLIAALEQGRPIGIVGDQASRQGLAVEFFGRPALFAAGPFDLAYAKRALILPVFIHRVRGPFHRVVVEPPMDVSAHRRKADAVQDGVARFAAALAAHVTQDPGQWLWMHKRWKHTAARRVLVLSDGKLGHVKQSLAVVEALRQRHASLTHHVVEVRYRHRLARALALAWSWWMPGRLGAAACLAWTLTPPSRRALLSRYADLIISCGAATAPANRLWSSEHGAKSIVLMNPAPIPLSRFDLVIAPKHDHLPRRANVVQVLGAVSHLRDDELLQARGRLSTHPNFHADAGQDRRPTVALFIGGDTEHYELTAAFADTLALQVTAACGAANAQCVVTTSRRTCTDAERILFERLAKHPRCRLLVLASRDPLNGTMEGMLGWADVAVVTGESISMVSEACASGRRVVVVEPPLRHGARGSPTKHQRFLRELAREGYLQIHPAPQVSLALRRALSARTPAKRLESFDAVREAVGRLL